jgi:hypothetical protein
MKKKEIKTPHQLFTEQRDKLLPLLEEFEKRAGKKLARSAMQKFLNISRAKEAREREIRKLRRELKELEGN